MYSASGIWILFFINIFFVIIFLVLLPADSSDKALSSRDSSPIISDNYLLSSAEAQP